MRVIYSIVLYLGTPLFFLHFAIRGWKDRRYLQRWKERLAWYGKKPPGGGIVVHAASVGEINAALPLINALAAKPELLPLTITTFTPTGSARAQSLVNQDILSLLCAAGFAGGCTPVF